MHQLRRILFRVRADQHGHCHYRPFLAFADNFQVASVHCEKNRVGDIIHDRSIVCDLAQSLVGL